MTEQNEAVETEVSDSKVVVRPDVDKYVKGKTATGAVSHHSGDVVASAMEGLTIDEAKDMAIKFTGVGELATKYDHLNVGMQRMNLGNRIRGAITKIDKENEKEIAKLVKEAGEGADAEEIAAEAGLASGEDQFSEIAGSFREVADARIAEANKAAEEKAAAAAVKKAEKEAKEAAKAAETEAEEE